MESDEESRSTPPDMDEKEGNQEKATKFPLDPFSLRTELEQALMALAKVSNSAASGNNLPCQGCSHLRSRLSAANAELDSLSASAEEGGIVLDILRTENEDLKQRIARQEEQSSSSILDHLEALSRENAGLKESLECRALKVSALEFQLKEEGARAEEGREAVKEMQEIGARLQEEVLRVDQEKIRLTELVRQSKEENEVLGKVMERITKDYEDLKRQQQQTSGGASFQAKSLPEDAVKIQALRNTARALESENDLLSRERDSLEAEVHRLRVAEGEASARAEAVEVELKAKDRERAEFAERFRRMEQEKVNVSRRSAEVEAEAEEAREEARAERGAREAAEAGLDRALRRGKELEEKARATETLALSLEQTALAAEREREEAKARMEHKLAEQDSIYEAKISAMHRELDLRLEEAYSSKEEETSAVKSRYIQMFDEKASELHCARERLSLSEAAVRDLQEREEELQSLLERTRAALDSEYDQRLREVREELKMAHERAEKVEQEMGETKSAYDSLQESYRCSVQSLGGRLAEITAILREHQEEEEEEQRTKINVGYFQSPPSSSSIPISTLPISGGEAVARSVSSEDSAIVVAEEIKVLREEEEEPEGGNLKKDSSSSKRKKAKARRRRNKNKA